MLTCAVVRSRQYEFIRPSITRTSTYYVRPMRKQTQSQFCPSFFGNRYTSHFLLSVIPREDTAKRRLRCRRAFSLRQLSVLELVIIFPALSDHIVDLVLAWCGQPLNLLIRSQSFSPVLFLPVHFYLPI